MIHWRGKGNTALKYLVSSEGECERIGGSVVNKVGYDISREMLQEGGS